jgi:hypothetical protein
MRDLLANLNANAANDEDRNPATKSGVAHGPKFAYVRLLTRSSGNSVKKRGTQHMPSSTQFARDDDTLLCAAPHAAPSSRVVPFPVAPHVRRADKLRRLEAMTLTPEALVMLERTMDGLLDAG